MIRESLKLKLRCICIIISILIIAAGFWVYRGRFVAVILTLSPKEELFGVDIEIPTRYKEVTPGEEILVQLTLYNLKKIGQVDVVVEYGIEDIQGNEIVNKNTTLAVEMQVSVVRSLDVPFEIRPGGYVLFARASYNGVVVAGSGLFRVVGEEELSMGRVTMFSLVAVIFVLVVIIIILCFVKTVKYSKPRGT